MDITAILCQEFHLKKQQCENVLKLIDDGNTIPFIARYRKEMTDSLDDQVLREIFERRSIFAALTNAAVKSNPLCRSRAT